MLTAATPLGTALAQSHGPSSISFTRTAASSSARRAAAPPELRRRWRSSARRTVPKVSSTTATTLSGANNGPAVETAAPQDVVVVLDKDMITMKATVTVHMKNLSSDGATREALYDLCQREWLHIELVSAELGPDGHEQAPISGHAKHMGKLDADFDKYEATFSVPASFGPIGAVQVSNDYHREMLLGDIKVFHADDAATAAATFHCNSWIHSSQQSTEKRTFFPLKSYLPSQTPKGVERLRKSELEAIRGDGHGERKEWERVYDYDVYNDLGDPEHDLDTMRPVLGGEEHPYPRRCRTGRPRSKTYPSLEVRATQGEIYVPRDEAFTERKQTAFQTKLMLSGLHAYCSNEAVKEHRTKSFPSLAAIDALYEDGFRNQPAGADQGSVLGFFLELMDKELRHLVKGEGAEFLEELRKLFKFETPEIHDKDKLAWFRDEEMARETLAGINPMSIQLVTEFPFVSKLDKYGPTDSLITKELIEEQINGAMTAEEAVKKKKLFMLDYHDMFLPYVEKVRKLPDTTFYGSRTLFFLTDSGTLRPIAIELTRPKSKTRPQWRQVFTPASASDGSVAGSWLWQLAKAHVMSHDTGYHQLVSHWLHTHCVVEPYVIAANRQLSEMHPIYRLLHPHFRFTMEMNAMGRKMLISAGGVIESVFAPGRYCMELSSVVYDKFWRFDKEALPEDLIHRGLAVKGKDGQLQLTIEDYPYANDGLLVWDAIKEWASDYVSHYYPRAAEDIVGDVELQGWWTEVRTKGHADKQDEPWWPELDTHDSLVQVLATIMWVTSAQHAAVNFGQYPFAGYMPNRPATARRSMPPEMGAEDMRAFEEEPEKVLLDTFPSQSQSATVLTILNVLSSHSPDEEYMGTHVEPAWQADVAIDAAFDKFKWRMLDIVGHIERRNKDPNLKNRHGPGVVPYVLLKPNYGDPKDMKSVMEMGIPNSISI